MDFEAHAREILTAYRKSHLAWKSAPDGTPEKVAAKRERGRMHGKVLELAELCEQTPSTNNTVDP